MDYTHYWRRPREIEMPVMVKIVDDFKKLPPVLEWIGVKLANGFGDGKPNIDYVEVCFNGSRHCGHPKNKAIVMPWPSKNAKGIAKPGENVITGSRFAGVEIAKRICDGDCFYESFYFPRIITEEYGKSLIEKGKYICFCATAFRPYDLAVTSFLVIAKHYLGDNIIVSTDGDDMQWFDGKMLCQHQFNYGVRYVIKHFPGKGSILTER